MKSKQYYTIILLAIFSLESQYTNAQTPDFQWAKAIGGLGNSRAYSIAIDPSESGDLYVTGIFSGTVDMDPGSDTFYLTSAGFTDIFISKFDGEGNFIWGKAIGGAGYDIGTSIVIEPGGNGDVYTTGYFEGIVDFDPGIGTFNLTSTGDPDIFISKLDSDGNFVWAESIGGTGKDYGQSITVDPAGNGDIFITGSFSETVDFDPGVGTYNLTSAGYSDIFVSKLNGMGEILWVKAMAGRKMGQGYSIAVDPGGSGEVYVSGKFTGTFDFDPGLDSFNLTSSSSFSFFISKLDGSGNFVWAEAMKGKSLDFSSTSVAVDPLGSGHVWTAGSFMGTVDFDPGADTFDLNADGFADMFISALDSDGQFEWAKSIGGTGADGCFSIVFDPAGSGGVFATGMFEGTVDFDPGGGLFPLTAEGFDIFISKFDDAGNFVWAKSVVGAKEDIGLSVAIGDLGQIYVAGYFYSPSLLFDAININNGDSSGNSSNIFLAKLDVSTATVPIRSKAQQVSVYPNPATNELTIQVNDEENVTIDITIVNVLGEVVFSSKDQNLERSLTIDVHTLPEGIYFVKMSMDGIIVLKKIVKV